MKKYFLFAIFTLTLIVGCGKDNVEPVPLQPAEFYTPNSYESLIREYNLLEQRDIFTKFIPIYDGNKQIIGISFYGIKDNKLVIKGFDKNNKKNILNFESKSNITTEISINKPYEGILTYKVEKPLIKVAFKDENNYIFLLEYLGSNLVYNEIYFISGNYEKIIKGLNNNEIINFGYELNKWYLDAVLINNFVFSYKGDFLFEIVDKGIIKMNIHFLNIEELIIFGGSQSGIFSRRNMKENKIIWQSKQPLKDLPSNIRIDKTTFETIDKDFTKCTFNYSTYEGDKNVLTVKINNNTGEFVQL